MSQKIDYDNAINFFTRNKHSDYPEVVFSSILSNLLDPDSSFVFKDELIRYVYEKYFGPNSFIKGDLKSEATLGKAGNIDILYKTDNSIMGIEVKIWDRSANNVDNEGTSQLIRYASVIRQIKPSWKLIFVVPTNDSPICLRELNAATALYPENIFMLPWNVDQTQKLSLNVSSESILSILVKLKDSVNSDPISQWIYNSLIEVIPDLKEEIPDPKKFPSLQDLKELDELWPLYEKYFKKYKVSPNPIHTTIGIPIIYGANKSKIHGNCLFRIRTTKKYYLKEENKAENLPHGRIELEIWSDIYKEVQNELELLVRNYNLEIFEDYHLSQAETKIYLLRIPASIDFEQFTGEFDTLMRKAVTTLEKAN